VKSNIEQLPAHLQRHGDRYACEGLLPALDAGELLNELEKTYAMEDERILHGGRKAAAAQESEVTFF
jgi:methyl-accepting chemotaxis protein